MNKNSINVISPYHSNGMWVFDDDRHDLVREPFVAGADVFIDCLAADIPNAKKGFNLVFSSQPFPDYTFHVKWVKSGGTGNWYRSEEYNLEGWLCPALLKYFDEPPKEIFAKAVKIS
jgi:hypothetical protein